jgi:hypothetical protein
MKIVKGYHIQNTENHGKPRLPIYVDINIPFKKISLRYHLTYDYVNWEGCTWIYYQIQVECHDVMNVFRNKAQLKLGYFHKQTDHGFNIQINK